jgi:hypothetical protein
MAEVKYGPPDPKHKNAEIGLTYTRRVERHETAEELRAGLAEAKDVPLTDKELDNWELYAHGDARVEHIPGARPTMTAARVLRLIGEVRRLRALLDSK